MLANINSGDLIRKNKTPIPSISKKVNKPRLIHIRMDKETETQIDSLKEMMHPSTKTEVFKNAIQLLDYMAQEYNDGTRFFIQKENSDEMEEIVIFSD